MPTLDGAAIVDGLHEAALGVAGRGGRRRVAARRIERDPARRAPPRAVGRDRGRPRGRDRRERGAPVERAAARRARHDARGPRDARPHRRGALRRAVARERAHAARAPGGRRPLDAGPLRGAACASSGAGHGFAGNVLALHGAPEWLDDAATLEARAVATARALAIVDGDRASWPPLPSGSRSGAPPRVQWCHGAPGVVTSLAALAHGDERHGALLAAGGELVWRAGPLARKRGPLPRHGRATASRSWRCSSARATSAGSRGPAPSRCTPSTRSTRLRAAAGRGRYTLFTGDSVRRFSRRRA